MASEIIIEKKKKKTTSVLESQESQQCSVNSSSNNDHNFCFWDIHDYGNTSRSRGAAAVHIHMTRLL